MHRETPLWIEPHRKSAVAATLCRRTPKIVFPAAGMAYRRYDPQDLIEYTARRARLHNWFWFALFFFLTR